MKRVLIILLFGLSSLNNVYAADSYTIENKSGDDAVVDVVRGTDTDCSKNGSFDNFNLIPDQVSNVLACGDDTVMCYRYQKEYMEDYSDWTNLSCGLTSGTKAVSFN